MTRMDSNSSDPLEQRKRIIAGRNRALGLVLLGLVVLFFAITIAKMG